MIYELPNLNLWFNSLGCGIGYGYLHRIPLRASQQHSQPSEKVPLLSDKPEEVIATTHEQKSNTDLNPLNLGAAPTIPTLPATAGQPSTLQVAPFTPHKIQNVELIRFAGNIWSTTFISKRRFYSIIRFQYYIRSSSAANFYWCHNAPSRSTHNTWDAKPPTTYNTHFTPRNAAYYGQLLCTSDGTTRSDFSSTVIAD